MQTYYTTIAKVVAAALLLCCPLASSAQNANNPADVASIDAIIKAYYEVVSGPAGTAPDKARDEWLHHPDALIGLPGTDSLGNPSMATMTLDGYYELTGGVRSAPFFEWEIHRVTERFGSIAHVWSTFATSDRYDSEPRRRGINSIQLFHDGNRWWIMSWIFDNERGGNPLPDEYAGSGVDG